MWRNKTIVDLNRLLTIGGGCVEPLWMMLGLIFQTISLTKSSVTQSKVRVLLHCRVQSGDRTIEVTWLIEALHIAQRLQIRLVGTRVNRGSGTKRRGGCIDSHESSELGNSFALKLGEIAGVVFEVCRTDLAEPLGVNKVHREINARTLAADTPLNDHGRSKLAESCGGIGDLMTADNAGRHDPQRPLSRVQI